MRVIAGQHKGRKLKTVRSDGTRPTSDKIKEAIFHKLGPFFTGGICLDLFAGSGALGIEALSRGMDRAIFIEKSSQAVRTIRANVEMLKMAQQCEIYRADASKALHKLSEGPNTFDLICIDPPYEQDIYQPIINKIISAHLLKDQAFIY